MTVGIGIYGPRGIQDMRALARTARLYQVDFTFQIGGTIYVSPLRSTKHIYHDDLLELMVDMRVWGDYRYSHAHLVGLETRELARLPLTEYEHQEDALYMLGPESSYLPQEALKECGTVLYVETPLRGAMNSATVGAIVLHHRYTTMKER